MEDLVLIVDDTPENLQILGQCLRQNKYAVAFAMSGMDALKFLDKGILPELILLDVTMPQMDGFETCVEIKRRSNTKEIPIIFLTARAESEDLVKGFDAGGVDYVTKPFKAVELLARIKTHIQLKKSREEVRMLQEMLPICSNCHKVRDDAGYWKSVEVYLNEKKVPITHSICPNCVRELYPDMADEMLEKFYNKERE